MGGGGGGGGKKKETQQTRQDNTWNKSYSIVVFPWFSRVINISIVYRVTRTLASHGLETN